MKALIQFFVKYEESDIEGLKNELKIGTEFKFMFYFLANVLEKELVIAIAIAKTAFEHGAIIGIAQDKLYLHSEYCKVDIPTELLAGGRLKMEDEKIIFYDYSSEFGKYSEEYLSLGKQGIADALDVPVENIIFE